MEEHEWAYEASFELHADAEARHVLVFDGIKMGAVVSLNGEVLGTVSDQFLRYEFPFQPQSINNLTVAFNESIACDGRWMACTGGWDWAPYTRTSQEGAATFTRGIWKAVYVAKVTTAAITHLVPHTFFRGKYPMVPLQDGRHAGFDVSIRVHFWAPEAVDGSLEVRAAWGTPATLMTTLPVHIPRGRSTMNVTIPADSKEIELWWPSGYGSQPLYNLTVDFRAANSGAVEASATRRIGFRHFAIVTGDDTDPAYVKASYGKEGTENNGMFFRVNGAAVFARGANMIPMEELEGRSNAEAMRVLIRSARDARFNVLRVWGGGIFLHGAFYDACDEAGIMLYHDMMYAQLGHSPQETPTQEAEFRHQVRRLSHHPSIVIWDGCNECRVDMHGSTAIYANFVLRVVAEEDASRSVWAACPSAGWKSGVDRLTSRPISGAALVTQYEKVLETHGPYQHGSQTWISVNNGSFSTSINTMPVKIEKTAAGPSHANIFASEFGTVVMSSFESMSATLKEEHWSLHGGAPDVTCKSWPCKGSNPMSERNYNCDTLISKWFGKNAAAPPVLNMTGPVAFKRQLYQCMIGQTLEMKSNIENRRSTSTLAQRMAVQ